jgi:DNA helicase-2/ATP-dependent DNA helicase PcrA
MKKHYDDERNTLIDTRNHINRTYDTFLQKYQEACDHYYDVRLDADVQFAYQDFKNQYKDKFHRIEKLTKRPYEGRVDIAQKEEIKRCYIGLQPYYEDGIILDVNPTESKQIIYDWRSSEGDAWRNRETTLHGKQVLLNRIISIRDDDIDNVITQFDRYEEWNDETAVELDYQPEVKEVEEQSDQPHSHLIDFNKERKNILSTLSPEQNAMIDVTNANLLIQGVPGSGKTVVGGYRLSKILYDTIVNKNETFRGLFVTSNNELLKNNQPYFSEIDLRNVTFRTFDQIILTLGERLLEAKAIPEKLTRTEKVFSILNDMEFIHTIDELLSDVEQFDYFVTVFRSRYYLTAAETTYIRYLLSCYKSLKDNSSKKAEDSKTQLERILRLDEMDFRLLNREKETPTLSDVERLTDAIDKLYRSRRNPVNITFTTSHGVVFNRSDNALLKAIINRYDQGDKSFLLIVDYNKYLDLYRKMYAIKTRRYKSRILEEDVQTTNRQLTETGINHILLDEAQDYSLFEMAILKEYYPNAQWTITGDVNQSSGHKPSTDDWTDVIELFGCQFMNLNTCFRSSRRIVRLMNVYRVNQQYGEAVSPEGYQNEGEVVVCHAGNEMDRFKAMNLIQSFRPEDTCFLYLKNDDIDVLKQTDIFQNFQFMKAEDSKGMEFKNVVILDTGVLQGDTNNKYKYMLVSRALNNLVAIETASDLLTPTNAEETETEMIF